MIQYTKTTAYERKEPNLSAAIVRTLPAGTKLDVTYLGNGWGQIFNGIVVPATYIVTNVLQDEPPIEKTPWLAGFVQDFGTTSTTTQPGYVRPISTTPVVNTPVVNTPAPKKQPVKTIPVQTQQPAPQPEPDTKKNTIWLWLGAAAIITGFILFKRKKK